MLIVITGPTATNKSKIAIEIAKTFNGEIINADAFQIYKELDIGTAKPCQEDMKIVPHHLYNFLSPKDRYSIFQYQKDARKCIDEVIKRNKTPILVGGSGLYIRSAIYDYEFKETSPNEEADLSAFYNLTNEELHKALEEVDPKEATKLHPNNRRRVLRALYIYYTYHKPKSEIIEEQEHKIIYKDTHIYAIDMDKKDLYERIDNRVNKMMEMGLVKEAIDLSKKYGEDIQAFSAIGYREIINNKNLSTDEIKEMIQKDTRHYAKRQKTFIKYQYKDSFKWVSNAQEIIDDLDSNNFDDRTESLIGKDNLNALKKSRIAIFGIGGVGGTAAESLIRSGVNSLDLIDFDVVNASNLNRQILFTYKDIDKKKVKVAKKRLEKINPDVDINIYHKFFDETKIKKIPFNEFDFVIDAIDSIKSKITLIKYLLKNDIPFISSLGMGNRLDLTKLIVTTLDKTHDDPLAKKLRDELKKDKIDLRKINVVTSNEIPIKGKNKITSMIFVPSTAGLLLASYAINSILKKENNYGTKKD